ncbi:MAG: glutamate--tRNA ligase [Nanoarchaeota archaeon]
MKEVILKYALQNAVKYDGKANLGAVIGKVFSELKDADKNKVIEEAKKAVNEVNSLKLSEQLKKLQEIAPELLEEKKVEQKREIPDLENAEKGKVVMRFAPNPNGPLSLGRTRPAFWNYIFAQKYKGKFLLRADDTDPKVKVPMKEAYKWILDDLKFLGIKPDKTIIQSKRLKIYYKYAEKLVKEDKAYVCICDVEEWRKLIQKSMECKCRSLPVNEQVKRWKFMFTKYKEGEAVFRIKTDIDAPNPALRDWPAFRIVAKSRHPLNKKARVWPLLNFASAIDDYELGVTHILRGIDLKISDERQGYIYKYFGWKYPETMYHGKLLVKGIKSTSQSKKLIQEGKLNGWDDPRLGTIQSLKRRGFKADAIKRLHLEIGLGKSDIHVSLDTLSSFNKEIIDKETNRYFFTENPKKIKIKNAPKLKTKIELHPDFPKKGFRNFETSDEFYAEENFEKDKYYRFMHLFNFKDNEFYSVELNKDLNAKLIHWLPVSKDLVNVEVVMDDASIVKGLGEKDLKKVKVGQIVQFERKYFVKCDKKEKDKITFYFLHR